MTGDGRGRGNLGGDRLMEVIFSIANIVSAMLKILKMINTLLKVFYMFIFVCLSVWIIYLFVKVYSLHSVPCGSYCLSSCSFPLFLSMPLLPFIGLSTDQQRGYFCPRKEKGDFRRSRINHGHQPLWSLLAHQPAAG